MDRKLVITGSLLVMLSIILGAMAAHGLKNILSAELIETFEKGVRYQFYSGLGLLIIGLNTDKLDFNSRPFFLLTLFGVILFSGCLYIYVFHDFLPALRNAAIIVPFGGVSMIAGWAVLLFQLIRNKKPKTL